MPLFALTAASLVPHLKRCNYVDALLASNYNFGSGRVPLAAFADTPRDARSICIAAIDTDADPAAAVAGLKPLGAPVIFSCHSGSMQWWKQTTGTPERLNKEPIDASQVKNFFEKRANDFAPSKIFEGKTLRRLPGQSQLTFVDAGLMPFVERTEGERLSSLVVTAIRDIEGVLGRSIRRDSDTNNAIKATFWLLAAKAFHDKEVDGFKTLTLTDIGTVFERVGRHYGVPDGVPPPGKTWWRATEQAAQRIEAFDSLANLSTESLAHVYENALVTPAVRKANGTHSTPSALVDYMVWQLWPWIEALPEENRRVFEPACGHGAFLVCALRMLRQWSGIADPKVRHDYLKKHLHGIESDAFALEVARLSLTLADIPHGNKWNLRQGDMFRGTVLEDESKQCGVLLANPPYERFTKTERAAYAKAKVRINANTKACEMLCRTIPHLTRGACFGVVVPQGLLHSKEGTELRRKLLADFELSEIDVFGDKLFETADHEAAVLLGRRKTGGASVGRVWFRRVQNPGVDAFRERFTFSSEEPVNVASFAARPLADLRVPELDAVWRYLTTAPALDSLAKLGQGLFHKGESLPKGAWTIHDPPRQGDTRGFANVPADLEICRLPRLVGINLAAAAIDRAVAGFPTGAPQVLLNYHPVSREAWRLKATLDEKGRPLTNCFTAVRPMKEGITALYLWALLNSPMANAFASCHLGKRDVLVGTMRRMPVPHSSPVHAAQIEQAAMRYRKLATSLGPLYNGAATPEAIQRALLAMDAAVLRAYDLPPRLEHQLLGFFWGVDRKGVGCEFNGYYQPDSRPFVPLHVYLSEEFQRSTADQIAKRYKPVRSKAALAAIDEAFELHKSE